MLAVVLLLLVEVASYPRLAVRPLLQSTGPRVISCAAATAGLPRRLEPHFAKAKKKQVASNDDDDDADIDIDQLELGDDIKQLLRTAQEELGGDDEEEEVDESSSLIFQEDEDDGDSSSSGGGGSSRNSDVVDSIDDIVADEDDESEDGDTTSELARDTTAWRGKVEDVIRTVVSMVPDAFLRQVTFKGGRIEVTVSATDDPDAPEGPSVATLQACHQRLYEAFELREDDLAVVTRNEILVASPGIGDVLRTDRDYVSFKGFNVAITTKEVFKKKTLFEGTLVERTDECVFISQKGRPIRIPRELIAEVRLPKPKYESTDSEMRKLR
jgi:ribosome maturation factor RimP